jgi:huntingtin interacting protein 1
LQYHLKSDVYGPLIYQYTKLLQQKLMFHANVSAIVTAVNIVQNRSIPGNLSLSDRQIASLGEQDVNNWFELAIEMLDYLDEILALQALGEWHTCASNRC